VKDINFCFGNLQGLENSRYCDNGYNPEFLQCCYFFLWEFF